MRYILARLHGLYNRELKTYRRLIDEMLMERKAIETREMSLLKKSVENQEKLVVELLDLKKDTDEERMALYECIKVPKELCSRSPSRLKDYLGEEAARLSAVELRIRELILSAKEINAKNHKLITLSHSFISTYINSLKNMRSRVFGYSENGMANKNAGQNLVINQRN